MSTEVNLDQAAEEGKSKALLVLGLTFVIPIIFTLIAVFMFM